MQLSTGTIGNYKSRIQKKIGAKNAVGIAMYALLNGLKGRGGGRIVRSQTIQNQAVTIRTRRQIGTILQLFNSTENSKKE